MLFDGEEDTAARRVRTSSPVVAADDLRLAPLTFGKGSVVTSGDGFLSLAILACRGSCLLW